MDFRERINKGLVLLDGAMGTEIQRLEPTDEEWDGRAGCSEVLNLTAPEKIQQIHESYFAAGADVVETNTFGANEVVLAEYDLAEQVEEINKRAAQLACEAAQKYSEEGKERFVAGSMGPGTRLPSLGQVDYDTLYRSYQRQTRGLLQGGVDLFMIETCQDLLQSKAALHAVRDVQEAEGTRLPLVVSVTVETTGTMLVGSDMGAAIAALAPFAPDVMGLNCAQGPDTLVPYVKQLSQEFPGPILVMPNAGLPQNIDGEMVYTLGPEEFVARLLEFIQEEGVGLVGGCCGTNPEFIRLLAERTAGVQPGKREPSLLPSLASLFSAQTMSQEPRPLFVGERANTNGSKLFRQRLLQDDWDGVVDIARQQQRVGAHALDLCVAYTGRDEVADMREAVPRVARQVDLPLFIDSTTPEAIEEALKLYGGRAVINSINLEDGEERVAQIATLARRYGAALIALTIDEEGMALDVERKLAVARRLYDLTVHQHGLRPQDLIFDLLTFTLGSGDETLRQAGIQTIDAIRRLKEELPGVFTILGVSNISFGLAAQSRPILNSVFLSEAVKAGLDMAIVAVRHIIPLSQMEPDDRQAALDLLYNRGEEPLLSFIRHFEKQSGESKQRKPESALTLEQKIHRHIVDGNKSGLEALLLEKVQETPPLSIVNDLLIPAMKEVGDLFAAGEMQLPFVLQAAEAMKFSVKTLEPLMERKDETRQTSLVLATVRGDVHDIGKNLVDIILTNNGFKVYNLGIKCEIDTMMEKVREVDADAIGMSGLLVKSTVVMKDNLETLRDRGMKVPVLLGGAALTRPYVDDVCAPLLEAPVVYCQDAFAGLRMMNHLQEGNMAEAVLAERERFAARPKPQIQPRPETDVRPISREVSIPTPPSWGRKVVRDIDLEAIYPYLTEQVLFRGRWGFRRGRSMSKEAYEQLIETEARPALERLQRLGRDEGLFVPALVYGYYPCNAAGDEVIIYHPDSQEEWLRLAFPRQRQEPHRCIADFFLPLEEGRRDLIALQVVTIGPRADEYAHQLYASDQYKEYLLFHGLSVEMAEALAEYWHRQIRQELDILDEDGSGIDEFVQQAYRGSRYSFGYPACPDLEENNKLFDILAPEEIGLSVTEEGQMVPEQTTSAFVVHHPQAKYFIV